jgi:hypothetical protein
MDDPEPSSLRGPGSGSGGSRARDRVLLPQQARLFNDFEFEETGN